MNERETLESKIEHIAQEIAKLSQKELQERLAMLKLMDETEFILVKHRVIELRKSKE